MTSTGAPLPPKPARWLSWRLLALNAFAIWFLWLGRDTVAQFFHEWRPTPARIVNLEVQGTDSDTGNACWVATFRYQVSGVDYQSDRHKALTRCMHAPRDAQQRTPAQYSVTVWYDVRDPALGVLDPTPDRASFGIWFACLLVFAALNAVLVRYARRPWHIEPSD